MYDNNSISLNTYFFVRAIYLNVNCVFRSIRQDGSAIGITGPIDFDRDFKTRQNFHMELIQLEHDHKPFNWMKVAEWDARSGFHITRSSKEIQSQRTATIHNKKFRVITRLTMPYLREVDPNSDLKGNDRYEGFIRDLMDSISAAKNFSYELIVEPKSHLGKYDAHSGRWDGMIGNELKMQKEKTY